MDRVPPLLEFPCDFPLKVFGAGNEGFVDRVAAIVRRHAPDLETDCIRSRASKEGRYLAVTVRLRARSQDQIDSIYRDLSADPEVLMAL